MFLNIQRIFKANKQTKMKSFSFKKKKKEKRLFFHQYKKSRKIARVTNIHYMYSTYFAVFCIV